MTEFLSGLVSGSLIAGILTWGVTLGSRLDHASQLDTEYVAYCEALEVDAAVIALTTLRVMDRTEQYVEAVLR